MSFEERSEALVELLDELGGREDPFVLVGGYAVSPFNPRFSTDLDVVVAPPDTETFDQFLRSRDFERIDSHEKHWRYATAVVEYEKRLAPTRPIGVDLLVNGLGCRQTEAQWSFEHLHEHSTARTVSGQTVSTETRVVDGSVLVAAKLHSARPTDLRDAVAVTAEIDLETVTAHLLRGDEEALKAQLQRGLEILDSEDFEHGFRSDFGTSSVQEATVNRLRGYLDERIEELE